MVTMGLFEHLDEQRVLTPIVMHSKLGNPKLRFIETNFILFHIEIDLIFVTDHGGIGQ